jgi:hypothetical protein
VNILGHTHVAMAGGRADHAYLLGAVLPDLAPMAGVKIARSALPPAVADGVSCHVRTDEAFHAHPAFVAGARAIRERLAARGVASGPARAVGHAGWELLLDGSLVGTATEAAFLRAMAAGGAATAAMTAGDASRWVAFVDRSRGAPALAFGDPQWVADRLFGMLARRSRLRLPEGHVPVVAEVLAERADQVREVAPGVIADTIGAVHDP